jgi:hypothetical protein
VLVRLGDPRVVPCFHCTFLLGMPSSTATGSPSAVLTQSFTDDLGLRQEPTARHSQGCPSSASDGRRVFEASLVRFRYGLSELLVSLADLTGVFPSQRRLLPPSFPTGRSPFPRSDITTVATEQAPPMGLSPIGTSASIAAQAPSLHRNYPASPWDAPTPTLPQLNLHNTRVRRKASGFLQVAVSNARNPTVLVSTHCQLALPIQH